MTYSKFFVTLKQHHPWMFFAILLVFAAVVFFVIRLAVFSIYWMDPAHRHQPLQPWMTPGYIARSYDIPRDDVLHVLMPDKQNVSKMTLDQIAQARETDVATVIGELSVWLSQQSKAHHD